ncbi:MAG: hypothetical protein ACREBV_06520 [Candidatus Zixiibacteriota bacterium]
MTDGIVEEPENFIIPSRNSRVSTYSKNTKTGRVVRVDMERLVKKIEELTGETFMMESWEE